MNIKSSDVISYAKETPWLYPNSAILEVKSIKHERGGKIPIKWFSYLYMWQGLNLQTTEGSLFISLWMKHLLHQHASLWVVEAFCVVISGRKALSYRRNSLHIMVRSTRSLGYMTVFSFNGRVHEYTCLQNRLNRANSFHYTSFKLKFLFCKGVIKILVSGCGQMPILLCMKCHIFPWTEIMSLS